jgi:hypothetical protein
VNDPPIRVMRSAALLSLWEILETANQGHIIKILKCAGVTEHKFKKYVARVGEHDTSPRFKQYSKSGWEWSKR